MITLIWCEDINKGIGKNNSLPWKIKEELIHFKKATVNHVCVMGRKTFESIGKPLPERINVILTSNKQYHFEGTLVFDDFQKVLELYWNREIFIIGGKQIYESLWDYADRLIVTRLSKDYECDVRLQYELTNFRLADVVEKEKFTIYTYLKK